MKWIENEHLRMPALGLGTWPLKGRECERVVRQALELGYRHFDTAEMYANEAEIGAAFAASGVPRGELFVTTKVWSNHLAAREVGPALEASLRKLRLDQVDLYLIHWPNGAVPVAETLGAMVKLMRAGKAKAIGVANFPAAMLREAVETHSAPVACDQVEFNIETPQRALLDYARPRRIAVTAYGPLAKGRVLANPELKRIAEKHGRTPAQIALRWLIEQDGVAAIPNTAKEANLRANIAVFDFALDASDRSALDRAARS